MSPAKGSRETGTRDVRGIDPRRSACVLIGVDAYTELAPLRSVRRNLREMAAALTDQRIWGVPESRVHVVSNPGSPAELCGPIRDASKQAEDTLLVYYAGHGLLDRHEEELLYLALPDSVENEPETAVADHYVRHAMAAQGSARRRVLILDCCFSGRVIKGEMSVADRGARALEQTLRDVEGSYVMTSTSSDRKSLAPQPRSCSAFTREFVGVLREGVPDGPDMLGLHDIFDAVGERMRKRRLPLPQEPKARGDDGVGLLPFVRNLAVAPPPREEDGEPSPQAPPGRRRALLAGALVLGVLSGLGMAKATELRQLISPRGPGGVCSPRATLLSVSDALNKQQVSNERVSGLSALALTHGGRKALALTDNETARLFPIRLGSPHDLRPQAETATTLRTKGGGKPSEWFDGEAFVLEPGSRTALVVSETDSAIRRFSTSTGRQIGKALPVPAGFKPAPGGQAPAGHTVESLALSATGKYLYAAMEGPLAMDGDARGRNLLRIQRYRGSPGGDYKLDKQYAYRSDTGMNLTELTAVGEDRLLALERQYVEGVGNAARVFDVDLRQAKSVKPEQPLYDEPADAYVRTRLLLDLAACPAGDPGAVRALVPQSNPLLQNVEGMALGKPWTAGEHKGRRPLYLISDDNNSDYQLTRLYALSVRL